MADEEIKTPEEEKKEEVKEDAPAEEVKEDAPTEEVKDAAPAEDVKDEEEGDISEDKKEEAGEDKKEESKPAELKTLSQAQELLQKASDEISTLRKDIKKMSEDIKGLKDKADKYDKLTAAEKDKAVDTLVERKLSLGILAEKDKEAQKATLKKFDTRVIKMMAADLKEVKPGVRKETLKGAEASEKEDEHKLKITKLMEGAGFEEQSIKDYKEGKLN